MSSTEELWCPWCSLLLTKQNATLMLMIKTDPILLVLVVAHGLYLQGFVERKMNRPLWKVVGKLWMRTCFYTVILIKVVVNNKRRYWKRRYAYTGHYELHHIIVAWWKFNSNYQTHSRYRVYEYIDSVDTCMKHHVLVIQIITIYQIFLNDYAENFYSYLYFICRSSYLCNFHFKSVFYVITGIWMA